MEQYLIDVIILTTLFVFAIFGFMTGFTGKILSIISWISSGVIAFQVYPFLLPYVRAYIQTEWVASVATGAGIFLIILILLSLISRKISGAIKKSKIGMLDRNLGILIGIALGIFFLGAVSVGMRFFINEESKPALMTHSKFLPWVEICADKICTIVPEFSSEKTLHKKELTSHKKEKISEKLATLKPLKDKKKTEKLYNKKERSDLNKLIEEVAS